MNSTSIRKLHSCCLVQPQCEICRNQKPPKRCKTPIKDKKLKDTRMCPKRIIPYRIKSIYITTALSSNSEKMGKMKQKDVNKNGFCSNY